MITKTHGDSITLPDLGERTKLEIEDFEIENDDDPYQSIVEGPVDYNGKEFFNQPYFDLLMNGEVPVTMDDQLQNVVVVGRSADENGERRNLLQ